MIPRDPNLVGHIMTHWPMPPMAAGLHTMPPLQTGPVDAVSAVPHWQSPEPLQVSLVPHIEVQSPHLAVVLVEASQPLPRFASQSPKPLAHAPE